MGCGASATAKPDGPAPVPVPGATSSPVAAASSGPLDRSALLEKVFKAMDADGNGKVDMAEFLTSAKSGEEEMELSMIQSFMDGNGDGKLSLEEWKNGMTTMFGSAEDAAFEKELKSMLQAVEGAKMAAEMAAADDAPPADDLDNMDDLDALINEVTESGDAELVAKAKAIFEGLDTDGGGSISKVELAAGLQQDSVFKALMGAKGDADAAMKDLDLDGDDEITWMEFEMMMTSMLKSS